MKTKQLFGAALCVLCFLTGCNKAEMAALQEKINGLSNSNLVLQGKILELQEKVKSGEQLATLLKDQSKETEGKMSKMTSALSQNQEALTAARARLDAQSDELKAYKASAAEDEKKKSLLNCNKYIDKILAHLDVVRNLRVSEYLTDKGNERETEENRLVQLANSEKSEVYQLIAELRGANCPEVGSIEEYADSFFHCTGLYFFSQTMLIKQQVSIATRKAEGRYVSDDYVKLSGGSEKDAKQAREAMNSARSSIENLKKK